MSIIDSLLGRKDSVRKQVEALSAYGISQAVQEKVIAFIEEAPDHELNRFNPHFLAARLDLPPQVCRALLAPAVVSGLFRLNWEAQCACGNRQTAWSSLREAQHEQYCGACHMVFNAHLDEEIVVSFSVTDRVRPVPDVTGSDMQAQREAEYGRFYGHDLLTIQAFRDLFVNEPLPNSESFVVQRMALLFTDLGGSTALYARQGDPRAFGLVREHFDVLLGVVDEAGGAVVKTIGDAVMAVFSNSEKAMKAALESQHALNAFNEARQLAEEDRLRLKVGVHTGPCLAVTLNERLDYFGTTVNATARVQGLARPGEVLFTEEVRQEVEGGGLLESSTLDAERLYLRGLEERAFHIYRVQIS